MSDVVMKDQNTVLIDGNAAGGLIDSVMNNRDHSAAINDAFTAWLTQHDLDLTTAIRREAENTAAGVAAHQSEKIESLQNQLQAMKDMAERGVAQAQNWQSRYQEVAIANQGLASKVNELQGQLTAATNLAYQLMNGTTEQAVAAAREWSRTQAISTHAGAAAVLAEHERLAAEAK